MRRPDTNIDHRRVPNLQVFFKRFGKTLEISSNAKDYAPGDIMIWNLAPKGDLPHIGIVTNQKTKQGTPLIVHNIGAGTILEDLLFDYPIKGHYCDYG